MREYANIGRKIFILVCSGFRRRKSSLVDEKFIMRRIFGNAKSMTRDTPRPRDVMPEIWKVTTRPASLLRKIGGLSLRDITVMEIGGIMQGCHAWTLRE